MGAALLPDALWDLVEPFLSMRPPRPISSAERPGQGHSRAASVRDVADYNLRLGFFQREATVRRCSRVCTRLQRYPPARRRSKESRSAPSDGTVAGRRRACSGTGEPSEKAATISRRTDKAAPLDAARGSEEPRSS